MQNPFEKILQAKDSQNRAKNTHSEAQRLYSHKPFYVRWHAFNSTCKAMSYLCQLISPLPAFAVFFFLFYEQFTFAGSASVVVAVGLAFSLSVGIELTKRYSTKNALIDIFNYRSFGLSLAIATLCSFVSIGTSFWGSFMLPAKLTTAPTATAPELVNLDNLKADQDKTLQQKQNAIQAKQEEIANYEKNNKSSSANRLSRRSGVLAGYNRLKGQLHALEGQLNELQANNPELIRKAQSDNKNAVQEATARQEKLTYDHNQASTKKGMLLGYTSLGLEIVFWLCMIFTFWYYKRAQTEFAENPDLAKLSQAAQPKVQDKPTDNEQPEPTDNEQPHQIGFVTDFQRLANGCTTKTDNGVLQLVFGGKTYTIERLRNNYHANKSKVKKYKKNGNSKLEKKYKEASLHWSNLVKILEQKQSAT